MSAFGQRLARFVRAMPLPEVPPRAQTVLVIASVLAFIVVFWR